MKRRILLILFAAINCIHLSAQTLDRKFAGTNGPVFATLQSGDTVYVGGNFSQVGYGVKALARFKPGSTIPETNFPELGNYTDARVIEPDGNGGFYLGGTFSNFNGVDIPQTAVIHVLNDGTLDNNFAAVNNNSGYINAIKKKGNRLYVAGDFYYIQGQQRQNLAALNAATGALENWKPEAPNSTVIKLDATDSLVFIAGYFDQVGNAYLPNRFAALNAATGKLITNFPVTNSYVSAVKTDDSNTLYIGGNFSSLGYNRLGIGKAKASDASLNTKFPSTDGTVWCTVPDGNGGYYIGGGFSSVGNLNRNNLAHILPNGNVDLSFYVNVNGHIYSMAAEGDKLYIAGTFSNVNGAARNNAASIVIPTGGLTAFNPDVNSTVHSIAVHNDTVYIGGEFNTVKGKARHYAASITTKNILTKWAPEPNDYVNSIVLNSTGTAAYLGGRFYTVKSQYFGALVKVNTKNGQPYSWSPNPDGYINSMLLNKNVLYIKGEFYNIRGESRQNFAAIDTLSGNATSLKADIHFSSYYYGYGYNDMSIDNGKLYIAGNFTTIQDSARTNIARIDLASGKVDKWNAGNAISPNNPVFTIYANGKDVVFGGSFSFLSSGQRFRIAAIDVSNTNNITVKDWQPDVLNFFYGDINDILHYKNDVYVCGSFSYDTSTNGDYSWVSGRGIMSLSDSTGKISHQFTEYPDETVTAMSLYDNKLVIGGWFNVMNNISDGSVNATRNFMAAYNLSDHKLSPDTWNPNSPPRISTDNAGNLVIAGNFNLLHYVNRPYLASIDIKTGLPTAWNPSPTGLVFALAIKDSSLFVGGSYYTIGANQEGHQNLAAVNTKTGVPVSGWSADANDAIYALAVKDKVLYAGGAFTTMKNVARSYAAAVSTDKAALKSWDPGPDSYVKAILPMSNSVYLGGYFHTLKDASRPYLAKVNATNGHLYPWNPKPDAAVYSIINSGKNIFVGGNFQYIASQPRIALAAFDTATNLLTGFDAKINGYYTSPLVVPLAAYGKNLYFGSSAYYQTVGDLVRGYLTGVDTTTGTAMAFDPNPDYGFSGEFSNAFTIGNGKLFAGGTWQKLGSKVSPSYFAVFTLEPQTQASRLNITDVQPKSATINFTAGSGEKRIVVIAQGMQPAIPADGINYNAKAAYKRGDSTGFRSYVVYNGNGNSINVTNLLPNRNYTVSLFEYNGNGSGSDYITSSLLSGSFTTPSGTAIAANSNIENIKTINSETSKLYPNPAINECTVSFNAKYNQDYTITILDIKGKLIMRKNVNAIKGFNSFNLKTDNLAAGNYLVNIINKNGEKESLKLVKQ